MMFRNAATIASRHQTAFRPSQSVFRSARSQNFAGRRFASTANTTVPPAGVLASPFVGGVLGGLTVFGAGYIYYRTTGLATVVDSAKASLDTAKATAKTLKDASPSPTVAMRLLKSSASYYASYIPGGQQFLDQAFEQIEELSAEHGDQVNEIVVGTYEEIRKLLKDGVHEDTPERAFSILQSKFQEVTDLANKVSTDVLGKVADSNPELRDVAATQLRELKKYAGKYGPEAQKIYDSSVDGIKELTSKGLQASTMVKVATLLKKNVEQAKELGVQAGQDAWTKAAQEAEPYVNKVPAQVKDFLEDNQDILRKYGGDDAVAAAQDVYADVKKVVDSKGDKKVLSEVMERLQRKVLKAKDMATAEVGEKSAKLANKALAASPLLQSLAATADVKSEDLKEIAKIASQHSDELKDILAETQQEIEQILKQKVKEARKVAKQAANETKKTVGR